MGNRCKALIMAVVMAVSSMNVATAFASDIAKSSTGIGNSQAVERKTRKINIQDKEIEEMPLNQDYIYDTNHNISLILSFTPQESGEYVLWIPRSFMWVGLSLYDSEGNDIDTGFTGNSYRTKPLRHYLEKGKKYYFLSSTDPMGDEEEDTVTLRLEKVPEVTSLTLDMRTTETEFLAELDECYIPGAVLNVKYEGIEKETQLNYGKGYDSDDTLIDHYGNEFQCYFTKELDENSERYKSGSILEPGIYHVVFYYNGNEMQMETDNTITVKSPEDLQNLIIGQNKDIKATWITHTWYNFTVPKTGKYIFSPINDIKVMERNESGVKEITGREEQNWGEKEGTFKLEQGKSYFIGLSGAVESDYMMKLQYDLIIISQRTLEIEGQLEDDVSYLMDEIQGEVTSEQKTQINDAVNLLTMVDSEEMYAFGQNEDGWGYRKLISDLENLALQANDTLDETIIEDTAQSGTTNIAGAALTAAKVGSEEGQKLAAKVQIQKSQKQYPELGSNTVAFNLKMSVVDKNHSNAVIQENVQPAMPITLQLPIPEQYQGGKFDVFFGKEDSSYSEAEWYYTDNQHTQVKVTVPVASEVVFVSDSCIGEHQLDENAWKITKQPTCGEDGEKSNTCKVCGTVVKQSIPATGKHSFGEWKTIKAATAKAEGVQERSCTVCGKKETQNIARTSENSTPALNVPTNKVLPLKVKQGFQIKVTDLAKDDSIVSWKVDNEKVLSVSSNGTIKGKKPGTATVTVQLKSGAGISVKVKVQKKDVTTSAIKVLNVATGKKLPKTVNLKVKGKMNLSVVITPVTSKQKVKYTSSNKKIVTVSGKGVVKAKKKGSAVITVQSGKKKVKMKVKVK